MNAGSIHTMSSQGMLQTVPQRQESSSTPCPSHHPCLVTPSDPAWRISTRHPAGLCAGSRCPVPGDASAGCLLSFAHQTAASGRAGELAALRRLLLASRFQKHRRNALLFPCCLLCGGNLFTEHSSFPKGGLREGGRAGRVSSSPSKMLAVLCLQLCFDAAPAPSICESLKTPRFGY